MSVPTSRTGRSPFMRSARKSAAVPGAPEAVTNTVSAVTVAHLRLAPFFGDEPAETARFPEPLSLVSAPRRSPNLDVDEARRRFRSFERFDVRVARGDHVSAPVAVEPHGVDRLTYRQVRVRFNDAGESHHLLERADTPDAP